jgi:L-ascorbate metabolism protein UlaG (beta-lactamase superfamily)
MNAEDLSRGDFLQMSAAGAVGSAVAPNVVAQSKAAARITMRWFGGGVYELATPDDRSIVLVDAWIWGNTGWAPFHLEKPPELQSAAAFAQHLKSRNPEAVLVALTHDHVDHMGDYFELLPALAEAGLPVLTTGQSDLMRVALVPKFKAANLDPATIVANGGAAMNFGGTTTHEGIRATLVPAVHSTFAAYPAAGFVIEMGGATIYSSGDTDLYGDMAMIGKRHNPDLAILSSGNGAFTMGPADAAQACRLLGVRHAVPVHYAHNKLVLGPQCGELFRNAVASASPETNVTVLHPGERVTLLV